MERVCDLGVLLRNNEYYQIDVYKEIPTHVSPNEVNFKFEGKLKEICEDKDTDLMTIFRFDMKGTTKTYVLYQK